MPINPGFLKILSASADDRRGLFAQTARRMGTSERNVEKDMWVCLTLDALFNGLPSESPRLLFKGGTSLSKAFGLISRFSEDVDVTVFRDDLNQPCSIEELEKLSGKKRQARLEEIREACSVYVNGPLCERLQAVMGEVALATGCAGIEVQPDPDDGSHQGLLVRYQTILDDVDVYIRPVVRIESGAKSALEPHESLALKPYIAEDLVEVDLAIPNVVTVDPRRTYWDKIVIVHGLRRWHDIRGVLRQEGQRISRHYYDLHRLYHSSVGEAASDAILGDDCVRHALMFFNRPDFDLAAAKPGTFALLPSDNMRQSLARDYRSMSGMVFGQAPAFEDVMASVMELQTRLNDIG